MSKRKRQPDNFDVAEFLRESDDDLKSALHSLLRTPETLTALSSDPESDLISPIKLGADSGVVLDPGPDLMADSAIAPDPDSSQSGIKIDPPLNLTGDPNLASGIDIAGPLISGSPINSVQKRRFAVREMRRAADAHSRAEQHVYEQLWAIATPYDEVSRAITMGFGAMANLVGLSESNARINVRSLLAKLAVEEIGEYNCERSQGRTYRIFNEAEILQRRREAGLRWYMRRTLAVVFVDPVTCQPLLKSKPLRRYPVLS